MTDGQFTAVMGLLTVIVTGVIVKAVDSWVGGRSKRLDELANVRNRQDERITKLESRLEEKDRQINTLQEEIEQLRDERRELRATVNDLQGQLRTLANQQGRTS